MQETIELLGREPEMRRLTTLLDGAQDGRLRLASIGGEVGIGKTRLAEEIAGVATARGMQTTWARSAGSEGAPPYWMWRQIVRSLASTPGALAIRDADPNVWGDVARIAPELDADTRAGNQALDGASGERFRVFESVTRFVESAAGAGLVVILDDLHASDEPTIHLLLHVLRWCEQTPLVVVTTYRMSGQSPGFREAFPEIARRSDEHLVLRGLDAPAINALLSETRDTGIAAEVVERVQDLTGGNPLFVQELGRALETLPDLPPTVIGVIRQRLGRLSPETAVVLRAAAIVGREFADALVASTADIAAPLCLHAIDEAVRAGLVETTPVPGRHRFVHALTRDAVDADLDGSRRAELHVRAARSIEELYEADLEPHLADLARHWAFAPDAESRGIAASWAERAADYAMTRTAFEEAQRLCRQALQAGAGTLNESAQARIKLGLAKALYAAGTFKACIAECEAVAAIGRKIGDARLVASAALVPEAIGSPDWSLAIRTLGEDALALIPATESALRARLLAQVAHANLYLPTDRSEAAEQSRRALDLAETSGDSQALVSAIRARHAAMRDPDGLPERETLADKMIGVGTATGSTATRMWGHLWRFETLIERGRLSDAATELERVAVHAGQMREPVARWHLLRARATLAQAQGRFDEALSLAREGGDLFRRTGEALLERMHDAVVAAVAHHARPLPEGDVIPLDVESSGPFATIRGLATVVWCAEHDLTGQAVTQYRLLGRPATWLFPAFLRLPVRALGVLAAARLSEAGDLQSLYDSLLPDSSHQVTGGGGTLNYFGPVELYLGIAAGALARIDDAAEHLTRALETVRANGARGFEVEAGVELAGILAARQSGDDVDRARSLADHSAELGRALGMPVYVERAEQLLARLGAPPAHPLTPRELEVADLVAQGMTNPQIAETLVVSQRTAQNHVQHILTKLGFSSRSQIATWVATRRNDL